MDNSLKTKEKPPKRGANAPPPPKGKTKTFLIGKELKTNTLHHTAAERGKRDDNKTQPKPPDSLRQGASQAAGAAPTLRYGPAGDSAPRLRLKTSGKRRAATSGAMLERLIRAFLVVGSVSVACAWTWPSAFPAADPRRPVGRRVARGHLCAPRQPARGHHRAALRRTILFGGAAARTRRAARAHP